MTRDEIDQWQLKAYEVIIQKMKNLLHLGDDVSPDELVRVLEARQTSILQPWVMNLGLRHQGVLMACVRGCDSVPKDDATKHLTRCMRATMLVSFDKKPSSFIEHVDSGELGRRMTAVLKNLDHYPIHYMMHIMHGSEIIGYKHPDCYVREQWYWFYIKLCKGFHVNPETEKQLDQRLGADETTFATNSKVTL